MIDKRDVVNVAETGATLLWLVGVIVVIFAIDLKFKRKYRRKRKKK